MSRYHTCNYILSKRWENFMKSNYSFAVLVLVMSSTVLARPKVNHLTTGVSETLAHGSAHLSKMTPSAVTEFEKLRSYAREVRGNAYDDVMKDARSYADYQAAQKAAREASDGLSSYLGRDSELTVLTPKIGADGKNTALLQQMEIGSTGKMSRSGFEIPSTHEKPISISLTSSGSGGGGGVNEIVAVKRIFDMPNTADGKLVVKNEMLAKQLQDGKTYGMVLSTEVTTGNNVVRASIISNRIDTREINVWYTTRNPNDYRNDLYHAAAHFKLPDEIKGEVVSVNINASGTRLSFRTTEGTEYLYSIQKDAKKDSGSYNPFIFTQISKTNLSGGANSLLASVKIYEGKVIRGRTSTKEPVRGMIVESAESAR